MQTRDLHASTPYLAILWLMWLTFRANQAHLFSVAAHHPPFTGKLQAIAEYLSFLLRECREKRENPSTRMSQRINIYRACLLNRLQSFVIIQR